MACFIVPTTEAVITKIVEKKVGGAKKCEGHKVNPFVKRLPWLRNILMGGSVLLAYEHVWHGEVQPFFPFLTAMSNASDTAEMLTEMSTVGVGMAVLVTLTWVGMVIVAEKLSNKEAEQMEA